MDAGRDWFDLLPKVDLHVHLEGAIPAATLLMLAHRHGGAAEVPDAAALARRLAFRDFSGFLTAWHWLHRWLRNADDLADAAEGAARSWAAGNVRYVEAHCSPIDLAGLGLNAGTVVTAFRRGLDRVPAVRVALIVDLVRNYGPEAALRSAAEAAELRGLGVVAVGLGGDERAHPPEPFAPAFALARARGLHVTVHAGETAGPASIRGALAAGAERIGHGIHAVQDDLLLAELAARRIVLEVCPTSNRRTGAVRQGTTHPLGRLLGAGCRVVLGSDDPVLFSADLAQELRVAAFEHGCDRRRLRELQDDAVAAAFLDQSAQAALRAALHADPAWTTT